MLLSGASMFKSETRSLRQTRRRMSKQHLKMVPPVASVAQVLPGKLAGSARSPGGVSVESRYDTGCEI
jgi:hypothetical protein